jgi:hypothetical protein
MKIGCDCQDLHIRRFYPPNVHTHVEDPLGVIPVVASGGIGKVLHNKGFNIGDRQHHKALISNSENKMRRIILAF